MATVCVRVPWSFLEPEESRFDWALFDTPAQRWIARGKRVRKEIALEQDCLVVQGAGIYCSRRPGKYRHHRNEERPLLYLLAGGNGFEQDGLHVNGMPAVLHPAQRERRFTSGSNLERAEGRPFEVAIVTRDWSFAFQLLILQA